MYTVKQGGDIHKGDLVAISNGNDFSIGIYYGRGSGGTFQYFHPGSPGNSRDWHENRIKNLGSDKVKPFALRNVMKSFINTPRNTRILKLNRDNITDQDTIEQILEAKEILKEFNITVNY